MNKTPHPNRPHREANDYNSFLKLLFTTMTNHNLFYDIKVKIRSAKLSCMWWKKLLKRSLRKIRVSTPFKKWYIYIILSILNVDLKLGQKKVILKHLTSYYKCISTAPIDSCMYNFIKTFFLQRQWWIISFFKKGNKTKQKLESNNWYSFKLINYHL